MKRSRSITGLAAACAVLALLGGFASGCRSGTGKTTKPTSSAARSTEAPTEPPTLPVETTAPQPTEPEFNPDNGTTHAYVNLLTSDQRRLYRAVESVCERVTEETADDGTYITEKTSVPFTFDEGNDPDFSVAYDAFLADNPWVFWLAGYTYFNYDDHAELYLRAVVSPAELTQQRGELDSAVNRFMNSVPNGDAYDREKFAHDYIIDLCSYDSEYENTAGQEAKDALGEARPYIYTAYGALCQNNAVCCGYAKAFQLLCDRMDIDSAFFSGMGRGPNGDEPHNWNAVRLDDEWYYVDVTWDDDVDEAYRYRYLNIDSDRFFADHTADSLPSDINDYSGRRHNCFLPACNSTRYCYYVHDDDSYFISDITDNQIAVAIVADLNRGRAETTLYLDPRYINYEDAIAAIFNGDGYMNRYMEYMFNNSPYQFMHYHYWTINDRNALVIRMED